MGLSDVKLHRFLSVPDDILLCKNENVTIGRDLTLRPRDTGIIDIRNKSFKFHMRSSFSSGTDSKLPERLRFKNCASDIDREYIKGEQILNCHYQTFHELRREMTVLRDSRNRRQALGNIFQDTDREEFDNIISVYENRTNTEKAGEVPEDDIPQHRRQALADIFQDVSEADLEHLFSISDQNDGSSEVTVSGRRLALADIFANVSEEQLRNIIGKCQLEIERSKSVNVTEMEIPRRCRRCAKAYIFDNVGQEEVQRVLQINETNIVNEELEEHNVPLCRRFALADIFRDVSEDDLWRIMSMFEEEVDGEDEADRRAVDHRRLALADIFRDVDENSLVNFLSDFCDGLKENDSFDVNVTRNRREALGDIFCGVESSELQNFMSKYGTRIEQMIETNEDENV